MITISKHYGRTTFRNTVTGDIATYRKVITLDGEAYAVDFNGRDEILLCSENIAHAYAFGYVAEADEVL